MPRVLLITYYFPPSGGSGVQRALKFAKYLPETGWQPTILTVDPEQAAYPDYDETLLEEIPDDVRVERTPVWDPYNLYARFLGREKQSTVVTGLESGSGWKHSLSRWLRANVFLPDARVGWAPHAARRAHNLIKAADHTAVRGRRSAVPPAFDAVITTGPPHSTHLVGLYLQRRHGIPWLADLRDPWTTIHYNELLPMSAPARWMDAVLERKVLRGADAVTVAWPAMQRELREQVNGRLEVLLNGYDPADFEEEHAAYEKVDHFRIVYLGVMNEAQNPLALWRALNRLKDEAPALKVTLTGSVDPSIIESIRRYNVLEQVQLYEYVPHSEAMRRMRVNELLLLTIPNTSAPEGIVPGKLFEYLASGRPIVGVGPPEGDAAAILQSTSAGAMFAHDDDEGVTGMLRRHYDAWAADEPLKGATSDAAAPYSRREQTRELAALLANITSYA